MKILLSLLLMFAALQPVSLQACDMADEQPMANHATMDHGGDHQASAHDCCDPETGDSELPCGDVMQCNSCPLTLTAIPAPIGENLVADSGLTFQRDAAHQAVAHSSPPFRPPIA